MAATVAPFATFPPLHDDSSDLQEHEDAVARAPFSVAVWSAYLAATRAGTARFALFERALQALPRSYKLWKQYLDAFYEARVRGQRVDAPAVAQLEALYERALATLAKMPRVWLGLLALLIETQRVTATRRAFNRALRALPITQHHRVWQPYLAFVRTLATPHLAVRAYRRYLLLEPSARDEFVSFLFSVHAYDEASVQLVALLDAPSSALTRPPHAIWLQLCELVTQHPDAVAPSLDVEAIVRSGIAQFSDEVGRLWCALATYFVRLGLFDAARDVYEEGVRSVGTVRDFSMIFDAYVKFVEAMLTAEMELAENPESGDEDDDDKEDADAVDHQVQVDRLLKIYEDVADRRPLLLNSVLLRQNPHNVREWLKRTELQAPDAATVVRTFAEAVQTVDPAKAGGKLPTLWVSFAKFYEQHNDIANARVVLQKAVDVAYRSEHELASIYCEWAELELRQDNFDAPLAVLRDACAVPPSLTFHLRSKTSLTAKDKVHKNVKLWSLRLDLEESLGDLVSTRAAYNDAFELKVVTPQMVLHFAAYLEALKYFEEAFRVYERGLALFPTFPYANELWQTYLTRFVARYGGTKVERARDLHEQAIKSAPAKFAKPLYIQYAAFEETHGMLRNVMAIFDRAVDAVPEDERLSVYTAYVKKAQRFFGVAKVRDVYQRGVGSLPDHFVAPLCLQFAAMETKLGELERARAIYTHASQFCDPRQHEAAFWKVWHDFEVAHGSEHSFLDMLRVKRSVVAQYSQVNYVSAEIAPVVAAADAPAGMVPASAALAKNSDAMAALEADLVDASLEASGSKKRKFSAGDDSDGSDERLAKHVPIVEVANEEEIELDDEDEDEDAGGEDDKDDDGTTGTNAASDDVEERALPATLFGEALAHARK